MARFSLFLGYSVRRLPLIAAISMTSCLITSTPDFNSVEQTPPFLVASSAEPSSRELLVFTPSTVSVEFSAEVRSEDAGEPVEVVLYIDYGVENAAGQPYRHAIVTNANVNAGTLGDTTPRMARSKWFLENPKVEPGCHSFTLIVSHQFDSETRCPSDPSDSSQITWQGVVCASADDCSFDPLTCPKAQNACGDAQLAAPP